MAASGRQAACGCWRRHSITRAIETSRPRAGGRAGVSRCWEGLGCVLKPVRRHAIGNSIQTTRGPFFDSRYVRASGRLCVLWTGLLLFQWKSIDWPAARSSISGSDVDWLTRIPHSIQQIRPRPPPFASSSIDRHPLHPRWTSTPRSRPPPTRLHFNAALGGAAVPHGIA